MEERQARLIVYCPLEGEVAAEARLLPLLQADAIVLYSRADGSIVSRLRANARDGGIGVRSIVRSIPHGVDRSVFRPILTPPGERFDRRCRAIARAKIFGTGIASQVDFLVLNANKNVFRKQIITSLRIFSVFARDKPAGVRLVLRSSRSEEHDQVAQATAVELGVTDRVVFTRDLGIGDVVDDECMNLLYNACDVGINTSRGEGWGLISYEHASTGAPQILPAHPAAMEFWRDYPGLVSTLSAPLETGDVFAYSEVNEADATRLLDRLHRDERFFHDMATHASRVAKNPELDSDRR